MNLLLSYLSLSLILNVLIYTLIFGIIKTNGHIALAKYPIKYLELLFTLISFEITILPTLTTQTFIGCFAA